MNDYRYPGINRAVLVVKVAEPFIDWLLDVSKKYDKPEYRVKREDIITDGYDSKNIYLLPECDEPGGHMKYIRKHCKKIFENELWDWCMDSKKWPEDKSWEAFKKWFDFEVHTMVFDMLHKEYLVHDF